MVLSDFEIVALNMFFKVQYHLIDTPDLLAQINCPIEIPKPTPEPELEKI